MQRRFPRGFSLIEAAIVLGIVGLVIGGIWAAASTVRTKMRLNAIEEFYFRAYQSIREIRKNINGYTNLTDIVAERVKYGNFVSSGGHLVGQGVSFTLIGLPEYIDGLLIFSESWSNLKSDQRTCIDVVRWMNQSDWSGARDTENYVAFFDTNTDYYGPPIYMSPTATIPNAYCAGAAGIEFRQPY